MGTTPDTNLSESLMSYRPPVPVTCEPGTADKLWATDFQGECVDFFADIVEMLGVPRSIGQIYGLLFSSPRPLSFTDIAERLDISRGSASQGLQALRQLGAVRKVSLPENRRELFEPELQIRTLVAGVLREKVDPLMAGGSARLRRLRALASEAPSEAGRKFSAERMKKLENWRRQLGLLLPILKTILVPRES